MNKLRLLGGVLLFALVATGFAYVIGTGFLSFRYGFNGAVFGLDLDCDRLLRNQE